MKVVRLYPKTNFHTFLNSDTLWGNLIYAYRMIYGIEETSKLLERFLNSEIPFKVSSVFPFKIVKNGVEEIIYYLPKPLMGVKVREAGNPEEMTYMKDFKKIRYVDKNTFEAFLKGEIDDNILLERFLAWKRDSTEKYKFKYLESLNPTYYLHNSIDRMNSSTLQADGRGQLYWEEEFNIFGNQLTEAGIYFLIDGENASLIEAPLRLLSDIGIGGNKSIGKGSFDFKIEDFEFNEPTTHNSYVCLSLFQPNHSEIEILKNENVNLYYDITTRFGKVSKDFNLQFQDKNPVTCFTEGSSFFVNQPLIGRLIPTAKYNDNTDIYSNYLFFGVKANLRSR
ncbi:MAG: type III-A CRISPR-associated RAMP protein Csm4 [Candidatus Kapaibacteriales bacterium]